MEAHLDFDDVLDWSEQFGMDYAIDRLAAALFVARPDPGSQMIALFSAYFDGTGNPDKDPYVIVGGYIASYWQWRFFELQWKAIHRDFSVELPFHMTDLQAASQNPERYAKQKNARADYVALCRDIEKVRDFFKKICLTQVAFVNCAVSCSVPMSIYNEVSSLLDLRERIPPYALAARCCIEQVRKWERHFDIRNSVECVFEYGDFEQGKFTDLMVSENEPTPIYKKKAEFAGLQGADQYAWEEQYYSRKELRDRELVIAKGSFKLLLNFIPKLRVEVTQASLIKLCEMRGINPRTGIGK